MFAFRANRTTGTLDSQGLAVFGEKTENLGRFYPSKRFSIFCSIPSWEYFVKFSGSEICLFSCFLSSYRTIWRQRSCRMEWMMPETKPAIPAMRPSSARREPNMIAAYNRNEIMVSASIKFSAIQTASANAVCMAVVHSGRMVRALLIVFQQGDIRVRRHGCQ